MKLRTIFKIVVPTLIVIFCVGLAVSLYMKMSKTEKAEDFNLYTLVPAGATTIVDTNSMVELLKNIDELTCSREDNFLYVSRLFSKLKLHINSMLDETAHGFSRQMDKVLISFHEPHNDLNQVFYCRLGAGDTELVEKFVKKYCSSSFPSRYFDYKGEEIRIYPLDDDTFIACYFTSEFLVVSYQKKLIEEVIDARLAQKSVLMEEGFPKIDSAAKMHVPATVYVRMQPLDMGRKNDVYRSKTLIGGWTEFDMKMNGNAIYFSGANYEPDSLVTLMNVLRRQEAIQEFPGGALPASTFYFDRRSISNVRDMLAFTSEHQYAKATYSKYIKERDVELIDFLNEHASGSLTTCMFSATDSVSTDSIIHQSPCALISVPLQSGMRGERALNTYLRSVNSESGKESPFKQTTYRTAARKHNLYALPSSTMLAQLAGITNSSLFSYACVFGGHLLIAPDVRSITAYIDAMERDDVLQGNHLYEELSTSLSDSYNMVMMCDLESALGQPADYVRLIPGFFFRNRDFFRHFVISAQFTNIDDVVYLNVVLLYKGGEDGEEEEMVVEGE